MGLFGYYGFIVMTSFLGMAVVSYLFNKITTVSVDHEKAQRIATAIRDGAMTFLREEYKIIAFVVAGVALLLGLYISWLAAGIFICGALFSLTTGFIGIRAATMANVRTTMAAKNFGEHRAFLMAFFGGGVMGFAVASFGLLGLGTIFYLFNGRPDFLQILISFGFGASLVAFFARVGGGIFTKSADVGADLVGKIEVGIPEDDPRNPAVIADNVGDCVGDTVGMGADIYESYIGAMISAIILSISSTMYNQHHYQLFPFMLASFGLMSSFFRLLTNSFF